MNVERLLFIDTETNEETHAVECITYLIGEKLGVIETFDQKSFKMLRDLWHFSDGVVMFNAPFDMGVLAKAYEYNGFEWREDINEDTDEKSTYWDMMLFGDRYKVKKLSFHSNLIQPRNRKNPVPIIDLLKLWDILIESGGSGMKIGLKDLIKRHLVWDPIPYSSDAAKTLPYRIQDVKAPKELMYIFLDKIKNIDILNDFTAEDWGSIKSSATFSKMFYKIEYDNLKEFQQENDAAISEYKLSASLEKAFHGGLTFAFYRGHMNDCAWVDIKGAYANAMVFMNTDAYLRFDIEKVDDFDLESPYLLNIESNFVIDTIESGLKTFYVHHPCKNWVWNYDIAAIENMIKDFKYRVIEIYKFIPKLDVEESLPKKWNRQKDIEQKENGKTTLYNFYKLLSNSSYGIKAQRKPSRTIHTNMVVAGMITSRAHLVLTTINRIVENAGHEVMYNDTDSSCFHFISQRSNYPFDSSYNDDPFDLSLIDDINDAISPFVVDYEGVFHDNYFLSLKRYVCCDPEEFADTNGKILGAIPKDKIRVHGKGQYDLTSDEMYNAVVAKEIPDEDRLLNIRTFVGSTERTLKRIMVKFPHLESNLRPFMFIKDVKSDVYVSTYLKKWTDHVDRKLSVVTGKSESFKRTYRVFNTRNSALLFYKNSLKPDRSMYGSNMSDTFIAWDNYEKELSDESVIEINEKVITTLQSPKDIEPIILHVCSTCKAGLIVGKNISTRRYKKHDYVCKKCYIRKPNSKNRSKAEIAKDKIIEKEKIMGRIQKITKENQNQSMLDMEKDIKKQKKENKERIKIVKERIENKEKERIEKLAVAKEKKLNKKSTYHKKINKDEKRFCKKCGVLLNPFIDGNITMRDFKKHEFRCLDCKAILREEKRAIKNNR